MNSPSPIQLLVMQARKHHRLGMLAKSLGFGRDPQEGWAEHIQDEFKQRRLFMGAARTIKNYGIITLHPKPVKRRLLLG